MDNTAEDIAGLVVAQFLKGLDVFGLRYIAVLVTLHNLPAAFVERQQVVVLVQYLISDIHPLLIFNY